MANFRKQLLLAKLETTTGVDANPTAATNAMLTGDISLTPLEADYKERTNVRPNFGNRQQLATNKKQMLTFSVELAGSGSTGTAPAYAPLLQACGMSEVVDSDDGEVIYTPKTDDGSLPSVSLYFMLDDRKHSLIGARGSVKLNLSNNEIPSLEFSFTGHYQTATTFTAPSANTTKFKDPLIVDSSNTHSFSLHGYAGILASLEIDLANNVISYQMVGKEEVRITERAPTGSITMEAPALSSQDVVDIAANNTLGALSITHGKTAGHIIEISAPRVQLTNPSYSDQDNVLMIGADLSLISSDAGDDELSLTFK